LRWMGEARFMYGLIRGSKFQQPSRAPFLLTGQSGPF
jgi:hypothetical protein